MFSLVFLLCFGSLVSGQLIVKSDKLPFYGSDFKTVQLSSMSPSFYDASLASNRILQPGAGLASFTLGGVPSYGGSRFIQMADLPKSYGSFLSGQNLIGTGANAIRFINQPVGLQAAAGTIDSSGVLLTQPQAGAFALGGANAVRVINQPIGLGGSHAVRVIDQPIGLKSAGAFESSGVLLSQPKVETYSTAATASKELRPINAAVSSLQRTVDYLAVPYTGEAPQTQVIHVPPNEQGIHLNFVSKSSPLTVSQQHISGEPGQVHVTESEDEPHRLVHNVKKSVIQEVNEVVQPYRVLKQEVKPVIEQAHTLVAEGGKIPLSGKASGIIATEAQVMRPASGYVQQQVALKPELQTVQIAQPAFSRVSIGQPAYSTIALSRPQTARVAIASQPMQARAATIAAPSSGHLGQQTFYLQPSGANLGFDSKQTILQPTLTGANWGWNRQSIAQPSTFSLNDNLGLNRQFIAQPSAFTLNKVNLSQQSLLTDQIASKNLK